MEEASFSSAEMERADLSGAHMKGTDLREARLDAANLTKARLEGTSLRAAKMEEANLSEARLRGAVLSAAQMVGVDLRGAQIDKKCDFTDATTSYAAVKGSDLSKSSMTLDQVSAMFGDGSVRLPEGMERPAHWTERDLKTGPFFQSGPFYEAWRKWQRSQGYTPLDER